MSLENKIKEALPNFTGDIFYNEQMSHHASLRVGGRAAALIVITDETQLAEVIRALRKSDVNILPVGNLTNIIVRDGGYRGAILLMRELKKVDYYKTVDDQHMISAQAGAALAKVVSLSVAEELTGMEFCAGIPGSIGGALWMNAGAYGKEMKDVVDEVSLLDTKGQNKILKRNEILFDYRKTDLPEGSIILSVCLKLEKGKRAIIKEKINAIMQKRQEKHPLTYPSAGSIFKNLPGLPAGRLIEDMGLKGKNCGDAEVSPQHANFIVNKGKATATEILELIDLIQHKAKEERGINLETEVVVIGEK